MSYRLGADGNGVWIDGQAGLCMGWCMGGAWCMGGDDDVERGVINEKMMENCHF